MFAKPAKGVKFIEQKIEDMFLAIDDNNPIKKGITRVIENLKKNAFSGEKIERRLIPWEYLQKYEIDNLYWYPLPDGWRLVYSIVTNKYEIIATIIEFFDHKNYARRFGYKN